MSFPIFLNSLLSLILLLFPDICFQLATKSTAIDREKGPKGILLQKEFHSKHTC